MPFDEPNEGGHGQGSITGDLLVGKDLPRIYMLTSDGRLTVTKELNGEAVEWLEKVSDEEYRKR